MKRVEIEGAALKLSHEHYLSMQQDLLSFFQDFIKSIIGTEESYNQDASKLHTCNITRVGNEVTVSNGWCFIDAKIYRVNETTHEIPTDVIDYCIVLTPVDDVDSVLPEYNYKKDQDIATYNACHEQTAVVLLNETQFYEYETPGYITICGRNEATSLLTNESINKSLRLYSLAYLLSTQNGKSSRILEGVNTFKYSAKNVITKYIDVIGWDMTLITDEENGLTEKVVNFPPGFYLGEASKSVLSYSFIFTNDDNTVTLDTIRSVRFSTNSCTLSTFVPGGAVLGTFQSLGHRGILKIEAYSYCQLW